MDITLYILNQETVFYLQKNQIIHIMMKKMIHIKNVIANVQHVMELELIQILIVKHVQEVIILYIIKPDFVLLNKKNVIDVI